MSSIPVLYHFMGSFYSQRARLALAEKEIPYKSRIVNPLIGEEHTDWYVKKNPKTTVPTMEHGGKLFTDSRDIVEYVDTLPSNKPRLCPEGNSAEASRVYYFRDLIESLKVDVLSYGALYHRDTLSSNPLAPSVITKERLEQRLSSAHTKVLKLQEECPKHFSTDRRDFSQLLENMKDESAILKVIDDCDKILAEVEEELRKQKAEYGDEEYWLVGKTFSIADIYLSCLLHRLAFVGQSERLFLSKRPITTDYYRRVNQRKSFQIACVAAYSPWTMVLPLMEMVMKRAGPCVLTISLVAIGGYAFLKRDNIRDLLGAIIGTASESKN